MKLKPFTLGYPLPKGLDPEKCYPFDVECLKSTTWSSDPDVLFIIGYVDSGDIKNGRLLTSSPTKELFQTLLDLSATYYESVTGKSARTPNISVINYNYHRNMHLKGVQLDISLAETTKRAIKAINLLKPKTVVCFGRQGSANILGDITKGIYYGMPQELDTGKHKCTFIASPSFHRCVVNLDEDATDDDYDNAITSANTIGYISRCMATMYDGSMVISADVQPSYRLLDTIEKFDDYLGELSVRESPFALDLETNSLTSYNVHISTIQFATSATKCAILILDHADTPFNKSERQYIKKRLRKFFSIKNPKTYIVGQNLSYDLRILRQVLKLPVIHWSLWDVMGGEHVLDENLKDIDTRLPGERTHKNYALHKICLRYGISWYTTAEFSKSERHRIHDNPITKDVLGYMAMDALAPMAIHRMQHIRAKSIVHGRGNYLETFHNYVLHVLGECTSHVMSTMEHRGIQISRKMFTELQGSDSKLLAHIKNIEQDFYGLDEVKQANRLLLDDLGAPKMGLFGDIEDWVFNISKEAHVQKLFLDQLGISDYEERKDGRGAKVGKDFQGKHKAEFKEVEFYGEYKKHKSIYSTYVRGWQKKMTEHDDSNRDFRIRPSYSFLLVTGRSNSFNPNLQNVPEHHSSAKFIKEPMKAPIGYLKMDADYSSHEVRTWALASRDPNLIATFKVSLQYIYDLRKNQDIKSYLKFKYESDTHKINYSGFTGVPIKEVSKEQRQAAKGIVFGSMYGIGDPALAKSINKPLKETKEIKGKFFKRFAGGKRWMDLQCQMAVEDNYVVSMLGRRRNLIGHLIQVPSLQAAFERRAQNSPIQGVASDFGYIAARLYTKAIRDYCEEFEVVSNKQYITEHGWEDELSEFDTNPAFDPMGIDCMVHDSIKSQVRYDMILVAIHLKEWAMTEGVRNYVNDKIGLKFKVDLGVEIDVGANGSSMNTWNWVTKDLDVVETVNDEEQKYTILGLPSLIRNALDEQVADGYDIDTKSLLKEALTAYKDSKEFLDTKYPLPYHRYKNTGIVN